MSRLRRDCPFRGSLASGDARRGSRHLRGSCHVVRVEPRGIARLVRFFRYQSRASELLPGLLWPSARRETRGWVTRRWTSHAGLKVPKSGCSGLGGEYERCRLSATEARIWSGWHEYTAGIPSHLIPRIHGEASMHATRKYPCF